MRAHVLVRLGERRAGAARAPSTISRSMKRVILVLTAGPRNAGSATAAVPPSC